MRKLRSFLKQNFLPLALLFWMLGLSMIFRETSGWIIWPILGLLYFFATKPVAYFLVNNLERTDILNRADCTTADAMIVLGAGRPRNSPELSGFQPTALSLERIRYTALIYRDCPVPILATGGGSRPESETMANVLKSDYGISTTWIESQSLTTWENAINSKALLGTGKKVLVVTHAWHMPRAILSFERAGFEVIPAPTAFMAQKIPWKRFSYWLPGLRNLQLSEMALHEYVGYVWYWLTSR